MVATQGSLSRVKWGSDFTGFYDSVVWGATSNVAPLEDTLGFVSVNEGSFASTLTEVDGVIAVTTDTADNDNFFMVGCPMKPSLGEGWMEARFQYSHLTTSIFVGYTSVLNGATPVMPAEFATTSMTYNASATLAGIQYDFDGTTDDFRAVFANAGTVVSTADAHGTRAMDTPTIDEWCIVRVEVRPNGSALVKFGHMTDQLKVVKEIASGLLTTSVLFPCIGAENRDGNARVLSIDYFYGGHDRDWAN